MDHTCRFARLVTVAVAAVVAVGFYAPAAGAISFASGADYPLPDPSAPFNSPSYGGVAIGDLNGDGKPEIMVPRENGSGNVWVFPNNGDGTFAAATSHTACPARYPVFGRRSDGSAFVIQLCTDDTFELLPGDGHNGFGASTPSQAVVSPLPWPQIGNLDPAGGPDLVFATGDVNSNTFCFLEIADFNAAPNCDPNGDVKNRAGQFVLASIFPPGAQQTQRVVDMADENNFGITGYVQGPSQTGWSAYVTRYASADNGDIVASGDLNGDGIGDIVVANIGDSTTPGTLYSMLARAGTGGFDVGDHATYAGTAIPDPTYIQLADFNADGKLDAIVAGTDNTGPMGNPVFAIMPGRGDGTFDPPQLFSTGFSPDSTAWWLGVADLTGAGKPDVVIANGDEQKVRVFLNTTPSGSGGGSGGGPGGGPGGGGGSGGGPFPGVTIPAGTLIVHKGSVKVRITCPPNVIRLCVGKDTLSTVSAFAVSIMRSKKHKLKLGATTFSIPAGSTKTLTIKLTAKARKLLAKKSRLAVLETVVAHDDRGTSKTATARITIRLAKKHGSH